MIFLFCFISQIISLLLVVNTMTFNCMNRVASQFQNEEEDDDVKD
jgi:hypothetical protein